MSAAHDSTLALRAAAERCVAWMRQSSPGCSDELLFEVLSLSVGMMAADVVFPDLPPVHMHHRAGLLMAFGAKFGLESRMQAEKSSCRGVA